MTASSSSRPLVASPSTSTTEAPCLAPKQVDDILAEFFVLVHVDPDHLPSLAAGMPFGLPLPGPTKQPKQSSVAPTTNSAQHSGRQHLHKKRQCHQEQGGLSALRPCTPPHRPLKKKCVKKTTTTTSSNSSNSSSSIRNSLSSSPRRFPSSSSLRQQPQHQHQHQHQQAQIRRRLFLIEDDKENAFPSLSSSST